MRTPQTHALSGHLTAEAMKPEKQARRGAHYRRHRNVRLAVQFLSVRGLKGSPSSFSWPFNKKHFYSQSLHKSKAMVFFSSANFQKGNIRRELHRRGLQRQALLQLNFHYERPSSQKAHVKLPSPQSPIIKATGSSRFLKPVSTSNVLSLSPSTVYPSVGFDMVAMTQWC